LTAGSHSFRTELRALASGSATKQRPGDPAGSYLRRQTRSSMARLSAPLTAISASEPTLGCLASTTGWPGVPTPASRRRPPRTSAPPPFVVSPSSRRPPLGVRDACFVPECERAVGRLLKIDSTRSLQAPTRKPPPRRSPGPDGTGTPPPDDRFRRDAITPPRRLLFFSRRPGSGLSQWRHGGGAGRAEWPPRRYAIGTSSWRSRDLRRRESESNRGDAGPRAVEIGRLRARPRSCGIASSARSKKDARSSQVP
jgi:hypothetical protein